MSAPHPLAREVTATDLRSYRIVAVVPCHNEEVAIRKVVTDLRRAIPSMDVFVYDNGSTDRTVEEALAAGAHVRSESTRGKGNVVRRAFADIDADIYVLIDGDDTYDASAAPRLVEELISGPYDHVLGIREPVPEAVAAYRPAHAVGNRVLNAIVGAIFGQNNEDMLSGYRVFSRRFVKSFPALSKEFEIETELTVHSLALRVPSTSLAVGFRDRAAGSESKLRTYRDGWRILRLILSLTRHERPVAFYGVLATVATLAAGVMLVPVLLDYVATGLVPRFPTFFGALALLGMSAVLATAGLVLDGLRKARHEVGRLTYLSLAPVRASWSADPGLPRSAEVIPQQASSERVAPEVTFEGLESSTA